MGAFKWVQGPPQWDWGDLAFFLQSRRIGLNSEYIKGKRGLRLRSREGVSGSGITKRRITQRSTKCPGFWLNWPNRILAEGRPGRADITRVGGRMKNPVRYRWLSEMGESSQTNLAGFSIKSDNAETNTQVQKLKFRGAWVEFGQGENPCHLCTVTLSNKNKGSELWIYFSPPRTF